MAKLLDPAIVYQGHPTPEPFYMTGNSTGVLLVHGYTGSPPEMLPVARYLHERGGYTVSGPLLPGHGTQPQDLMHIRWQQWANAVNFAYQQLAAQCERVFLVGLSMGGLLSLYQAQRLASDPASKLAGIVALSTPIYIDSWLVPLAPMIRHVVRWRGNHSSMEDKVSIRNKQAVKEIWSYLRSPSNGDYQVLRLIREVRRALPLVKQPLLIIQSHHDTTAPPPSAQIIFDNVGSSDKQLIWLDNSNHVITVDYERERVLQASYDFINQHS